MAWKRSRKSRLVMGMATFTLLLSAAAVLSLHHNQQGLLSERSHKGRKLLESHGGEEEERNCTPRSIEEFPEDFLTEEQRKKGGVIVHIIICLYIFAALAIVCDDYFVASLEKFSTVLHMQSDVAGATFMAAGSSAPELFTSIVGVFFAKSDVGLGTIVGSAVFNILVIIAVVALFAGQVIHLLWYPMTRDCIVYVISILTLAMVIMDNHVAWYEALVMLALYALYIVLMVFNEKLGNFAVHQVNKINCCKSKKSDKNKHENNHAQAIPLRHDSATACMNGKKDIENGTDIHFSNNHTTDVPQSRVLNGLKEAEEEDYTGSGIFVRSVKSIPDGSVQDGKLMTESEFESPFQVPDTWPKRIGWVIMMPLSVLFVCTIPDCRRGGCWAKLFPVTFVMSIVWLGALTYVMVWMVTIIGDTLSIPDAVMGLTLLAAGTSIPDALASLFVAKDGFGDMAVSNSIGSNIFDILLCLGLPWFLQTVAISTGDTVFINSNGILFTTVIVLATVFIVFLAMVLYGWKLDKKIGILLLIAYVIVITIACLFELNVFGDINLPSCP